MQLDEHEEKLLRSVALQNARAILLARERAEQELLRTKEALERKTKELRQQREWFKVTLSSIGDAVIVTDTARNIRFLNPAAEAMTGWNSGEAAGQPLDTVFKIIHEHTRQPVENPITKTLRQGIVVGLANHTALIAKDGREIAIEDSAALIKEPTGVISGAIMVFHDVTERRRAEAALHETNERTTSILESITDGFVVLDEAWRFTYVNQKAEEVFRSLAKSRADLLGKVFWDVFPDAAGTPLEKKFRHAKSRQVKVELELFYPPLQAWFDLRAYPAREGISVYFQDVTQRRRAELERERLTSVLERSLNEIYIFNPETLRFEFVNEGARRNLGYSLEEMRQKTPLDLKPEFTEAAFQQMIRPLLNGEKEKHIFHTIHRRRDGTDYPVEVHLQLVTHAGSRVFVAVILDLTGRRKAEEQLRRSEAQLLALADSISQLAWIAEPDGRITWYNRRWYEYTGTTLAQMEGWGWQSVHDPQRLPVVLERWKASIRAGEPFEMEFPLRGADGVFRWFLTRVNPVRDTGGRVVRWFGTNTDLDQLKRTQEAAQDETRLLELLNQTGRAIAAQLNLQALLQTVTDAATELTGAKFGAFFYKDVHPEGEAFLLRALSGASREVFEKSGWPPNRPIFKGAWRGEGVVRSDDITRDPRYGTVLPPQEMPQGRPPLRSYLAVPVQLRSGEVIGVLCFGHPDPDVFTDRCERLMTSVAAQAAVAIDNARLYETAQREIAERKRAEAELQKAKDELEERVQHRTASLLETSGQLETFCYTIAHDLRAPLRAQQSFAQVLLEDHHDSLDENAREYVGRILRSARRLDQLVIDLLAYSRVSRSDLKFENVDLETALRDIESGLAHEIKNREAAISTGPLLPVSAYPPTLHLIITNLISNALKFAKTNEPPKIRIWSEPRDRFVRLWIEDNGIGIHPENREKIFGVFERLHPMDTYPGTGIGLAIVQKAMERMGGSVGVESEPGQGSRFWIELPKAQ